jgi:hypothetical protein
MSSKNLFNMPTCQTTTSILAKCVRNEIHRSGPEQLKKSQDDEKVAIRNPTT